MLIAGVIGFIVLVYLMGDVDLCMRLRLPVAVAAILLLIVNIAIAKVTHGARNWITPAHEMEGAFFPQPEWLLDAINDRLLPLPGHVPTRNFTGVEQARDNKRGV